MTADIFKVVGSDRDIVLVSRVATGKASQSVEDDQIDRSIKHLIRNRHWSPFEMQHLYIDIEAPIYVLRQLMRSPRPFIEQSRRYTTDDPRYDESVEDVKCVIDADTAYKGSLKKGSKPEDARKLLPVATYSKVLWNPNLRDLLHFLRLRLDAHAQLEIRQLAQSLYDQLEEFFPVTMKYFTEYELGEFSFTIEELEYILDAFPLGGLSATKRHDQIQKRIIKNAQRRISMVERVLAGRTREAPDSTKDSAESGSTSSDGSEVP